MHTQNAKIYVFEDFRFDTGEKTLKLRGTMIPITPKVFETLQLFVEHPGHLIEKDELMQRLWPDRFVEESNLTFNIKMLRKALGDDAQKPTFIDTVPKRGYRFIADVKRVEANEEQRRKGEEEKETGLPADALSSVLPILSSHLLPVSSSRKGAVVALADWRREANEYERREQDSASTRPQESVEQIVRPELVPAKPGSARKHFPKPKYSFQLFGLATFLIGAVAFGYYFYGKKEGPSADGKKSIAVLPFKPLNADSRDEALEMGMAEALITSLSNLKQVVVRPMSAVRKYTDLQQDSIKVGQELQTEVVLDGSIQKAGERVRVTVKLIDVGTGMPLWSEQFDESFTDIFKMQDSIAERITNALALRLSRQEKEQLVKHYTDNPEAYQLYLQGEYLWLNRRKDNWAENALTYYQRALEKDPNFALAYIGIAECYIRLSGLRKLSGREAEINARSNIVKALEIDDNLAEAHNALAELKYQYEYDWAGAEKEFKKAIELNPNVAAIRLAYGWFLMSATRFDEAGAEIEKARELDPSSLTINISKGWFFYFSRQYDQGIQHFQNLITVEPNSPGSHHALSQLYQQKQMYREAFEAFIKHQSLIGMPPEEAEELQKAFKVFGFPGFLRKMLDTRETKAKTEYVSPAEFVVPNTLLGQKDEAFAWLEKTQDERNPFIVHLKMNPVFDSLRGDPRFDELVRRVGLK